MLFVSSLVCGGFRSVRVRVAISIKGDILRFRMTGGLSLWGGSLRYGLGGEGVV